MGTFRLEPASVQPLPRAPSDREGLDDSVLLQNAVWFTRIRWVAAVPFVAVGAMSMWAPGAMETIGITPPKSWPWVLAGVLAALNIVTLAWLRVTRRAGAPRCVAVNIGFQIVTDLVALTLLVYLVGPADTVVPFAYLFHIALACIFFGRRESFAVFALSALLFVSVVCAEVAGILPSRSIVASSLPRAAGHLFLLTTVAPTILIWFVVWYLVSTISVAVRSRDAELNALNKRLVKADEERNLQVLRVAHDLKAPFVGIESNIHILRTCHWDKIPEEVRKVICNIESRGSTLRARIGDILALGNLRSDSSKSPRLEPVRLRALLDTVIQDLQELAAQRGISIALAESEATVISDPAQLRILFINLVSNAVSYSRPDGSVRVEVVPGEPVRARVADHGIGINDAALPHVFEEYYRAKNAMQFNAHATGLGLAIVRQVATNLLLSIDVSSKEGDGTVFEVAFNVERKPTHGTDTDH